MSGPWWVSLPRDIIAIGGADAQDYLQGQISQDIADLGPGSAAWSLVLAPQGKVDAWFRIHARADGYVADLDAGYGEVFIERLERFRLRVDVTFEPLDWQFVAVRGDQLEMPSSPQGGLVVPVTWTDFEGFDIMGPDVEAPAGVAGADRDDYEYARIAAGWPAMGRELTEKTIPAEAGIVDGSVSFTKGCYTGQELVARIDSRGNRTPRQLTRLRAIDDTVMVEGDEVTHDGAAVGTITSAATGTDGRPSVALAYLHRSVEVPADVDVRGRSVSALGR